MRRWWLTGTLTILLTVALVANAATNEPPGTLKAIPVDPYMDSVRAATSGIGDLNYGSAQAFMYQSVVLVRVPGPNYGGVTLQVSRSGEAVNLLSVENEIGDGSVHSRITLDSKQIGDLKLDKKTGAVLDGWMLSKGQKVSYKGFDPFDDTDPRIDVSWQCFRTCLANVMFVPSWLIGLAGAICSAVCVVTAGTGCVLCVQGVLIAYGAEISFCLGYCKGP